jgi:4-diphosphocytidyl-2-C-methyl-D-erythritol kinase
MKPQTESLARELIGRRLVGAAPAKLNLALRVVGRRGDGFHLLEMYNVVLGFGDTVAITVNDSGRRQVSSTLDSTVPGEVLPGAFDAVETNLAARAASSFLDALEGPFRFGFEIEIVKRIPLGAGLGGGSSDAATVLRLLAGSLPGDDRAAAPVLGELALTLGADVPFFLGGRSAIARGIGEILEPIAPGGVPAGTHCLVVLPPIAVSTPAAYARYREAFPGALPPDNRPSLLPLVVADDRRALVTNDLERVVLTAYPEVGETLARVRAVPGGVAGMTGSGSALFCLPEIGASFPPGVVDAVRVAAGCRVVSTVVA